MRTIPPLAFFVLMAAVTAGCFTPQLEMVPMRDGALLATDVYTPNGPGPWPVLVFRTPYGREEFRPVVGPYLRAGVAVVSQDMRGRFDSEGVDMIFTTDADGALQDGYDTMEWVVDQEWCDGQLATFGASARGIVQYMQAASDPPGLESMSIMVGTPNLYSDAMFHSGVFRHQLVHGWLEAQASEHFLESVDEHPYEDDFWAPVQTADAYGEVHVPALHVGGWYDIFDQGTVDGFVGYQHEGGEGAAGEQRLIMGPWTHGGLGNTGVQGELTYPEQSMEPPYPRAQIHQALAASAFGLDVSELDIDDVPTVQYYVMGAAGEPSAAGNEWRTADDWPPASAPIRLHLGDGGELAEACPGAPETSSYVYDPQDPSPTICGANLTIDAGPCDQGDVEARADTLVFTTAPFASPVEVTGRLRAHLFVELDRPDTDLMVRLTDVYPDGRSMLVTDGAARVAARGSSTGIEPLVAGEVVEVEVDLFSTSIVFAAGHSLRISVTSSNWPRYEVNRNNGLEFAAMRQGESLPVEVTLHRGGDQASYVELPMPERAGEPVTTCP